MGKRARSRHRSSDGGRLADWLREGADEIDKAHELLDEFGVPRKLFEDVEVEMTLAARIYFALGGLADPASAPKDSP